MLREMYVEQLIDELSVYPKNLKVVVVADYDYELQHGIDMGISQDKTRLVIHVGKPRKVALG